MDTAQNRLADSAMSLLSSGIPLSLLMDLVLGPASEELLELERIPGQRAPGA